MADNDVILKIELDENLKFECTGNPDFVFRERSLFYRAAGCKAFGSDDLDATQNKRSDLESQTPHAMSDLTKEGVLTASTKISLDLTELIRCIQSGNISVNIGDTLSVFLKDGTYVEFVITQEDDEYIRFESTDCIGGEYVTRDKVADLFDNFWELLPDELKNVIVETPCKWLDEDGIEITGCFKLFLPSAPEVFPDDQCYGDNGLYEQMEWYKDRRHRLRRLSSDGDTVRWWLLSAYAGNTSNFAIVNYNGNANYNSASYTNVGAPVCFQIQKSK